MSHPIHQSRTNGRVANGAVSRRKVVMVLEDHASVGGLIAGLVRQAGYRAVRAWGANEATRLARGRRPDLILLDLNLPYKDGLDLLQRLRSHEATRRCPVLIVASGGISLSVDERKLVSEVVTKPFDIDIMLNAVRKALGDPQIEVQPRPYDQQDQFLHGY